MLVVRVDEGAIDSLSRKIRPTIPLTRVDQSRVEIVDHYFEKSGIAGHSSVK
jgi:hypothetical protein